MTNLPFNGRFQITNLFSNSHPAMDLVGLDDTTVYCVCDGFVIDTPNLGNKSYGKYVRVRDSATNRIFIFAHLSSYLVSPGQTVSRTTPIGKMGSTGNSTGPHLHIELRDSNFSNAVNQNLVEYMKLTNCKKGVVYNSADFQITPPEPIPNMMYAAHCQNLGWQEEKRNGEMAGLYGQGLRVEAIIINADINIQYRVHMAEKGWSDWVPNGCMAGTIGESRAIEAIEIQSSKNIIVGQAYVENIGYQNEVRGTQITIGTTGQALRIEGFRLKFE